MGRTVSCQWGREGRESGVANWEKKKYARVFARPQPQQSQVSTLLMWIAFFPHPSVRSSMALSRIVDLDLCLFPRT
jgi:hypothetical protein